MILTCPACTMRYLVSEGAVGPNGRRVRCANCGHQWVQEPEAGLDAELFDGADQVFPEIPEEGIDFDTVSSDVAEAAPYEDDFQSILKKEIESTPIPEGVKPIPPDEDFVTEGPGQKKQQKKASKEKIAGYAAAVCFWLVVLGAIIGLHPQISRAWPASNLLYDLVGMKPVPPGEGLALDSLSAEMGEGKILLKGNILNLRTQDIKVPAVMASIVDAEEKVIDRILIAPPVARLKAEGKAPFDVAYPTIPDGAANVRFAFSFVKVEPQEEAVSEEEKPSGHAPEPSHEDPEAH
ncbi:MAG: hypothetical protein DI551_05745 [Micavibrio aeruginosavorus]|uniref:Zinc finger/thioredoxin putative domain-containing protein n=1 Tax=Micavibrio aeruginosavorus TaxID=349221 RepID=A0A2W5MXU0_9BACT|nr:MAG: hypothetical protein DI551_05745 [Micavibrio aeruginosavorus]